MKLLDFAASHIFRIMYLFNLCLILQNVCGFLAKFDPAIS